jgi:hypothetical protein
MGALEPHNAGFINERSQKGCCLIVCFAFIHAFKVAHSLQARFSGADRLWRTPKNVLCTANSPSCAVSHLLLFSCRRILVTCIFKVPLN